MKYPPRAELLLAGLLALSLAAKAATNGEAPAADPAHMADQLSLLLQDGGLEIGRREAVGGAVAVEARRGACRVWTVEYSAHETAAYLIAARARAVGPLQYAYGGRLFSRAPAKRALLGFYLWREARRLGLAARRRPIVAVAASGGCDLRAVDWQRVAVLAR